MRKNLGVEPLFHEACEITNSHFGVYTEVGKGSRVLNATFGDYSYCDRFADIANAQIGKFANIASYTRIGPTDHPMHCASPIIFFIEPEITGLMQKMTTHSLSIVSHASSILVMMFGLDMHR